jgi:hypothetical protein
MTMVGQAPVKVGQKEPPDCISRGRGGSVQRKNKRSRAGSATATSGGANMSNITSGTGRGSIKTYPLPPDGFDPRAASPLELRRYGLPQRPDPAVRPELAALWDEVFSRKLSYITPAFLRVEELVPGLGRAERARPDVTVTNSSTWSGAVTHAPPGETIDWVYGQWNVPYVEPGGNGPGTWYADTWIGIDGNTDVTQIGTMQIVSSNLTTSCFAWYEWWSASYPSPWQVIPNFPVSFGDTIYGLICMQSTTAADFSMINMTTGVHVGFGQIPLNAPPNTASMENQAEWINERPEVGGVNPPLANFSPITFNSAYAGHGLDFVVDGGTDTLLNMVENGTTVATTTVETPTSIKIVYTGGPPPVVPGQLLAYADDGTPGNVNVSDPVAVGFGLSQQGTPGGWLYFKSLFAGPDASAENTIYAVGSLGLVSYADDGTSGNVNVSDPVPVGPAGGPDAGRFFAGANTVGEDRIYVVEKGYFGQLVSYADDMTDPVVVGSGNWLGVPVGFLFAGANTSGEPCIYARDPSGQLLSFTDDGTPGNVSVPVVVGSGGWLDFKFLFAGENLLPAGNRIYAVPA